MGVVDVVERPEPEPPPPHAVRGTATPAASALHTARFTRMSCITLPPPCLLIAARVDCGLTRPAPHSAVGRSWLTLVTIESGVAMGLRAHRLQLSASADAALRCNTM